MTTCLNVLYPVGDGTHFDYEYYLGTHMPMVGEVWGELLDRTVVSKGMAGGPDVPAGYHTVATLVFASPEAMQEGLAKAQPLLDDIPNFTNTQPQMLFGEVIA